MRILHFFATITVAAMLSGCNREQSQTTNRTPVDYVNPYIGNISHLLVPTFPTIQLPNSMLRVYPERADYTTELLNGLPLIVTNHALLVSSRPERQQHESRICPFPSVGSLPDHI